MDNQPQNYQDLNQSNNTSSAPPVTPNMTQNSQSPAPQSSLNAYQQMQYTQEIPKKHKLNSLMITLLVVILLLVVVGVTMIIISGQKQSSVVVQDKSFTDSTEKDSQAVIPADDTEQSDSSPNISDASLVVQSFYDDLLSALKSGPAKQYEENFKTYIQDNQNLTTSYRAKLAKTNASDTNSIIFDTMRLPSKIQYDDPVSSPKDDWIATQRVILGFGNKEHTVSVTLKWTNSTTQAGYWQIDNITKIN